MKHFKTDLNWLIFVIFSVVITSCSALKEKNYEQEARAFLDQFEKNLTASDEVILQQFKVDKTSKAIMKAIAVMQNKNMLNDSIKCTVNFAKPLVTVGPIDTKIELLALHQSIDATIPLQKESKFTIWLSPNENDQLFISSIEADKFYAEYKGLSYELSSRRYRARDIASREKYFEKAEMLKLIYDSVIWYTTYQDSIYYYVTNGPWSNYFLEAGTKPESPLMGLVSETGREVVPPEFDLIGTIGFEGPGLVEVKKNGLVGKYNIDGTPLTAIEFEWVIPYTLKDSITSTSHDIFLAKKDSLHGWIDSTSLFIAGYPSQEAKKYVRTRGYLAENITINGERTTMTEVLSLDHMGSGIVVPPSYLVKTNVVNEIVAGIYTGENALGWGEIDEIETEGSLFVEIAENLSAVIVFFTERYVEGREGFYTQSSLTFVDSRDASLGQFRSGTGGISFKKIDSTVLEMRTDQSTKDLTEFDYYSTNLNTEMNPLRFQYFKISDSTISPFKGNREFNFAEFVKLDSSYFTGNFKYLNTETGESLERNFLTAMRIAPIRNEILARYGFIFADEALQTEWQSRKWYNPKHSQYADFLEQMNEIDKHNLLFLETLVGTLDNPTSV